MATKKAATSIYSPVFHHGTRDSHRRDKQVQKRHPLAYGSEPTIRHTTLEMPPLTEGQIEMLNKFGDDSISPPDMRKPGRSRAGNTMQVSTERSQRLQRSNALVPSRRHENAEPPCNREPDDLASLIMSEEGT